MRRRHGRRAREERLEHRERLGALALRLEAAGVGDELAVALAEGLDGEGVFTAGDALVLGEGGVAVLEAPRGGGRGGDELADGVRAGLAVGLRVAELEGLRQHVERHRREARAVHGVDGVEVAVAREVVRRAEEVAPLVEDHRGLLVELALAVQRLALAVVEAGEDARDGLVLGGVVHRADDGVLAEDGGGAEELLALGEDLQRRDEAEHEVDVAGGVFPRERVEVAGHGRALAAAVPRLEGHELELDVEGLLRAGARGRELRGDALVPVEHLRLVVEVDVRANGEDARRLLGELRHDGGRRVDRLLRRELLRVLELVVALVLHAGGQHRHAHRPRQDSHELGLPESRLPSNRALRADGPTTTAPH